MVLSYFTLRSLAAEWNEALAGAIVEEAFSQQPGELSLAFTTPKGDSSTVVFGLGAGRRYLFRRPGRSRARRNTASVLADASGMQLRSFRHAHRDRILLLDIGPELVLQAALFGPRPNVWLVDANRDLVIDSFLATDEWVGQPPPAARSARDVASFADFEARWTSEGSVRRAVSRAMPLFDAMLAAETMFRAGVVDDDASRLDEPARRRLFEEAMGLEREFSRPRPTVYWQGERPFAFALVPMAHLEEADLRSEPFESVDAATRVFSQKTLAQARFDARFGPIAAGLDRRIERLERRLQSVLRETEQPSRAETYERLGHLLMAQATDRPAGLDQLTLPDIMGDGSEVTIPLDPSMTAVENAQRYYDRARRARAAFEHSRARARDARTDLEQARALRQELGEVSSVRELEALLRRKPPAALDAARDATEREPFRRYPLPGGFEAWVGKNARANAELTTRHARPHDLWLHARGVSGSHVVIRRAERDAPVPRRVIEAAARLAAHFSRAGTSAVVPVIVTERKFVRPIKGGPIGAMRVDREDVILVEPRGPGPADTH